MRLEELFEEYMPSVKTPTSKEVAEKHGISLKKIKDQLKKGVMIELEHTKDREEAREIALDHLGEYPDYYDRLEKVET